MLVAECPPAATAVMLRECKIIQKIRGTVFLQLRTYLQFDPQEPNKEGVYCVHVCNRSVESYAAAEGGGGAAADVAVGGEPEIGSIDLMVSRRHWQHFASPIWAERNGDEPVGW